MSLQVYCHFIFLNPRTPGHFLDRRCSVETENDLKKVPSCYKKVESLLIFGVYDLVFIVKLPIDS